MAPSRGAKASEQAGEDGGKIKDIIFCAVRVELKMPGELPGPHIEDRALGKRGKGPDAIL